MTIQIHATPTAPGRGAWTFYGGLLPLRDGTTDRTGYYRLNRGNEPMVGQRGTLAAATFSDVAVHLGVRGFQRQLGVVPDGLFGPKTDIALRAFQAARTAEVGVADGILGRRTARALFRPLITKIAKAHGVSPKTLAGLVIWESQLDPAAVGVANGADSGLCQINLLAHKTVVVEDAFDPAFALNWTATDLRKIMDRWRGKTKVDLEVIAIANHNSPVSAAAWAERGVPPYSKKRAENGFPQIDEYVNSVLAAGEGF